MLLDSSILYKDAGYKTDIPGPKEVIWTLTYKDAKYKKKIPGLKDEYKTNILTPKDAIGL